MTVGNFRLPDIQLQLNPADPYGRFNCAAYSGGMAGDADTRGALVYTGRQVRSHSSEPRPNPLSPGLTIQQVAASLFDLSDGRIDLDVYPTGSPFSTVPTALRAGKWALIAVKRAILVDAGYGYSSTFRGAHASDFGYDQVKKAPVLLDPLVKHPIYPGWGVVQRAMLAQMYDWGVNEGAYFALTRDVFQENASTLKYSALVHKGDYFIYTVAGNQILGRHDGEPFSGNTSASCSAPVLKRWAKGGDRKLVQVTAKTSRLYGMWLEPGTTNVRLKVTK